MTSLYRLSQQPHPQRRLHSCIPGKGILSPSYKRIQPYLFEQLIVLHVLFGCLVIAVGLHLKGGGGAVQCGQLVNQGDHSPHHAVETNISWLSDRKALLVYHRGSYGALRFNSGVSFHWISFSGYNLLFKFKYFVITCMQRNTALN